MEEIYDIPPAVTELARQLLSHEADQRREPDALGAAIEQVYSKFRLRLVDLIGQTGFVALFGRALHLARHEAPILAGITIDPHTSNDLMGIHDLVAAHPSDAATDFTTIVAHFIWLLVTFIGEQLSMQLIEDIWPQVVHDETAHAAHGGSDS
jgi:hypothetical protein